MSPSTLPSDSTPKGPAASPVRTPARARRSGAPTSDPKAWTAATRSKAARTARSAPHSPQNLSVASADAPHEGHRAANGEPHSVQNFLPASFSEPHDEQRSWASLEG